MFEPMFLSEAAPSITMPTVEDWYPIVKAVTNNLKTSNYYWIFSVERG